jgi:sugar phosphate permease
MQVGTAIMGNWFGSSNRGWIFGTWTCHQYVGNILAAVVTSSLLYFDINYMWALVIPAVLAIVWGVVCVWRLPGSPQELSLETEYSARKHLDSQMAGFQHVSTMKITIFMFD